jgi:hypothetical protein
MSVRVTTRGGSEVRVVQAGQTPFLKQMEPGRRNSLHVQSEGVRPLFSRQKRRQTPALVYRISRIGVPSDSGIGRPSTIL